MADAPKLEVVGVPVLSDNYAWLLFDPATQEAGVVDPGEAEPVLAAANARGWHLGQVWVTHWHQDHVGGVEQIRRTTGALVTGPKAEADKIAALDALVDEGDVIRLASHTAQVMRVPGHTQGHVAFHFAEDSALFTGDTLFAMGCGRLFEGTPADMWGNMQRYRAMPGETMVYCGHEYTQSNARFARHVDPDNTALEERAMHVDAARANGKPTVPFTLEEELATNPFLRAGSAEQLGKLRADKDAFRG
ncbi:hydroxyacylglutathione hydrolase [Sphingomonas gellani]|uniref:Hydroxyacylglutathione hydrolase n=1 Tax=Sphingomonas gellani TaxID=1166340 RepID=A0A1H8G4R3_9SPHN|nr:hydroxyacylglutathione hydrolase [Sphingomonas gellani]SEN39006.1 hydroxyacylglutathione hydrolase [Sphingomonas gellani]